MNRCRVTPNPQGVLAIFVTSCLALLATFAAVRGDQATTAAWAQWRGPSGQGYAEDTRVPLVWNETKNILWKTSLPGRGNSTPIVWGEHVFLTASSKDGTERLVLCVNRADGKIRWQQTASKGMAPGKTHGWNGYASPSCTTDGERVYAFFGTPGLFCYDLEGKLLWQHSFGLFTSEAGWGTAASPLLFDDLVIQNCDNDGAKALPPGRNPKEAAPMALVALDKRTGQVRWQTPRNQGRGFSTPRLITTPAGRVDLVLNGPLGVWGYEPRTGKETWHCFRTDSKDNARFGEPVPVSSTEMLYAPSGRPGPFQAIGVGATGNATKTQLRWQVDRRGHRDVSSQILWKGLLYAADNKGVLTCYDAKSGKVFYNERLSGGAKSLASPVVVRDRLLFVLDTGETVVVEPGPQFKVTGRNVLGEGSGLDFAASPAIADGQLYLRSQSYLYCIAEKGS